MAMSWKDSLVQFRSIWFPMYATCDNLNKQYIFLKIPQPDCKWRSAVQTCFLNTFWQFFTGTFCPCCGRIGCSVPEISSAAAASALHQSDSPAGLHHDRMLSFPLVHQPSPWLFPSSSLCANSPETQHVWSPDNKGWIEKLKSSVECEQ